MAGGLRRLDFESGPDRVRPGEELSTAEPPPFLAEALEQLRAYLDGRLRSFHVPLDLDRATPFQSRVYERLLQIPYGQVATYGRIARDLCGDASAAARAVGQAVGANPLPIVVPCHRVVGADGRLGGFGGGTRRKAQLLALEGIVVDGPRASSRVRPEVIRLPI